MSKNIVIQENGVAQTLNTISYIETNEQGHGSVDWVPFDECNLGEITIKKNGDVTAKSKGFYAFSKVIVKAKGKAVGKDKNGNYKVVEADDNGNLIEHNLPTYIRVVTSPTKTSYIVAEPIDISGMVVKAYYGDDTEYGEVPRNEITIDPIVAPAGSSGEGEITVKWKRVGDKVELTDSFGITVNSPPTPVI